jgi:hypothetical protein
VEDDKSKLETHGVAYIRADHRETTDPQYKLRLVLTSSPLRMIDFSDPNMRDELCSTKDYAAERRKDPRGEKTFGNGVAAFVWTEECELFIARHLA